MVIPHPWVNTAVHRYFFQWSTDNSLTLKVLLKIVADYVLIIFYHLYPSFNQCHFTHS